jgi:ribonuclease P protein component
MSRGEWLRARHVRASYVVEPGDGALRVGISVPTTAGTAVRRNRLRRLMRVAIGRERERLHLIVDGSGSDLSIVFQFRVTPSSPIWKITVRDIEADVQKLCAMITDRTTKEKQS